MKKAQFVSLGVALALLVSGVTGAVAGHKRGHEKVESVEEGQVFCPSSALIFNNIVIPSGRCYALSVLRDTRRTFLAFVQPGAEIPRGQLVRLTTPAGAKVRGRIFFLVPIQPTVVLVPVNSIALVPVRIEDFGPRLSITVISQPSPNVTVIFNVQQ